MDLLVTKSMVGNNGTIYCVGRQSWPIAEFNSTQHEIIASFNDTSRYTTIYSTYILYII